MGVTASSEYHVENIACIENIRNFSAEARGVISLHIFFFIEWSSFSVALRMGKWRTVI